MKPIFCGNFEYDARQSELERLFRRYGRVDRVDMKSGFAFVYMEDERDAEDAIRALDRIEFGRKGRRLRVEWTKQERSSSRRPESTKKSSSNSRPSKTLFVINFDPYHTRTRDLERHFEPYGKILNVRVRRNFAFIQYESLEDATKALDATNLSKLLDRVITVEFAMKDDDDRRNNGYSPDRIRDRSPRRGYDRRERSSSPYRRERGSPDYGHGRARSPSPYRRERGSSDYARGSSRSPSRKESRKERDSERGRGRGRDRDRDLSQSPTKDRETDNNHKEAGELVDAMNGSPSPRRERSRSNGEIAPSPNPGRRASSDDGLVVASPSPQREQRERAISPEGDYARDRSPAYSDGSQSPPARKRSRS